VKKKRGIVPSQSTTHAISVRDYLAALQPKTFFLARDGNDSSVLRFHNRMQEFCNQRRLESSKKRRVS
jgi:hypothetical protein